MARSSEVLKYVAGILFVGSALGAGVTILHGANAMGGEWDKIAGAIGAPGVETPDEKHAREVRIQEEAHAAVDSATVSAGLFVVGGAAAVGHVVFKPHKRSVYSTGGNYR